MANSQPEGSRPSGPNHSRTSSTMTNRTSHQHAPATPSNLRNSRLPARSNEDLQGTASLTISPEPMAETEHLPELSDGGMKPTLSGRADVFSDEEETQVQGYTSPGQANLRTRLLDQQHNSNSSSRDYGTTARPKRPPLRTGSPSTFTSMDSFNSTFGFATKYLPATFRRFTADDPLHQQELDMTTIIARRHGIKGRRRMYLMYYFPFTNWIQQYRWSYVKGDLVAALTMASFYLPMSLSYATNLAHIPAINGLYSFVFNPFIYALFGTCPQMVVGPEAAGSLLTGQVVRENIRSGKHGDEDGYKHAQVAGMVTGLAGAVIFLAGICRLGFLDSVLSRPFLRGFISAIGIVILVDQLIPEMGLEAVANAAGSAAHGSSLEKIMFLFNHIGEAHALTCAVSFGALAIAMVCREVKRQLQPRMNWVAYIPDRFAIVVGSALLAWACEWEEQGLDILGDIRAKGKPFVAHFPFEPSMLEHATDAFSTGILIALLGFFESSVAAKSLGVAPARPKSKKADKDDDDDEPDGIRSMVVSPNRELIALGVANLVGSIFMALPAFGGYGRSKVNASTGGKTPMSSAFLSIITVICILFLLPYFYYIPKGVLSAMISVVAYSLIEEAPHDIHFFYRISGWSELFLMLIIFLTTFFWNLRIGIFVGIAISLLRLLRHSTRPRIQILGRVPGTKHQFENAELDGLIRSTTHGNTTPNHPGGTSGDSEDQSSGLEYFENTLIIKIPEPLTFANTGSLKHRLRRIEDHGTDAAHPALPRVRSALDSSPSKVVVFDVHGVTGMDPAAAQVLLEIVSAYVDRGVRVYFARLRRGPRSSGPSTAKAVGSGSAAAEVWRLMRVSGIVDLCGGERHFVGSVQEALDLAQEEGGAGKDHAPSAATDAATAGQGALRPYVAPGPDVDPTAPEEYAGEAQQGAQERRG